VQQIVFINSSVCFLVLVGGETKGFCSAWTTVVFRTTREICAKPRNNLDNTPGYPPRSGGIIIYIIADRGAMLLDFRVDTFTSRKKRKKKTCLHIMTLQALIGFLQISRNIPKCTVINHEVSKFFVSHAP